MPKYGLALHTTTPHLGIALSNFDNDVRCQTWDLGYELSSHLHQYLIDFLKPQTWRDLKFIAVAKGPGGFTGTRIGIVTARTLAQQLNIPVFGISTLAAIAHRKKAGGRRQRVHSNDVSCGAFYSEKLQESAPSERASALVEAGGLVKGLEFEAITKSDEKTICVQMDARRGELFAGIYKISCDRQFCQEYFPDTTIAPEVWKETLATLDEDYLLVDSPSNLFSTVDSILELANWQYQQGNLTQWSDVIPFYGQSPV
jgi:tRNA threonylcarbamoyl adenosine modification protein YeaZ